MLHARARPRDRVTMERHCGAGIRRRPEEYYKAAAPRSKARAALRATPQPAFPSPAVQEATLVFEQRTQCVQLGGQLIKHGEQAVHAVDAAHDHQHQRIEEQAIRAEGRAASPVRGRRLWEPIHEPHEQHQQRLSWYQRAPSVFRSGTLLVRRGPRPRNLGAAPIPTYDHA